MEFNLVNETSSMPANTCTGPEKMFSNRDDRDAGVGIALFPPKFGGKVLQHGQAVIVFVEIEL